MMRLPKKAFLLSLLSCQPFTEITASECPIYLNEFNSTSFESGVSESGQLLAKSFNDELSTALKATTESLACTNPIVLQRYKNFSKAYCSQQVPESKRLDELDGTNLRESWLENNLEKEKIALECLSYLKIGLELAQTAWPYHYKSEFKKNFDDIKGLDDFSITSLREKVEALLKSKETASTEKLQSFKLALLSLDELTSALKKLVKEIDIAALSGDKLADAEEFKTESQEALDNGNAIDLDKFNTLEADKGAQDQALLLNEAIKSTLSYELSQAQITQQLVSVDSAIERTNNKITKFELEQKGDVNAFLAELEKEKRLGESQSENAGLESFFTGVNFSPKYENDDNKGFEQANVFIRLGLDLRWESEAYMELAKSGKYSNIGFDTAHLGATIHLGSENRFECDENDTTCKQGAVQSVSSVKFNDVSDVLDVSLYGTLNFYKSLTGNAEMGVTTRAGVRTRDELDPTSGDNLDQYYQVGARWASYYESWYNHPKREADFSNTVNSLPFVFVELKYGEYQGFAGLKRDYRMIADMAYRPFQERPFYIGLHVNGAQGPDHIDLFMMYSISPLDMLSRL